MHYRLKYITIITATIIFYLSSALQITSNIPGISLIAQAQTNQSRKAEADKLSQQAQQQFSKQQFDAALQSFQQALTTARKIKQNPLFEAVALVFVTLNHFIQGDSQKTIASAQEGLNFAQNLNIPYYKNQFETFTGILPNEHKRNLLQKPKLYVKHNLL